MITCHVVVMTATLSESGRIAAAEAEAEGGEALAGAGAGLAIATGLGVSGVFSAMTAARVGTDASFDCWGTGGAGGAVDRAGWGSAWRTGGAAGGAEVTAKGRVSTGREGPVATGVFEGSAAA